MKKVRGRPRYPFLMDGEGYDLSPWGRAEKGTGRRTTLRAGAADRALGRKAKGGGRGASPPRTRSSGAREERGDRGAYCSPTYCTSARSTAEGSCEALYGTIHASYSAPSASVHVGPWTLRPGATPGLPAERASKVRSVPAVLLSHYPYAGPGARG